MFTGIIEGVGIVKSISRKGDGAQIEIACDFDLEKTAVGDSISASGCCLTVTSRLGKHFWADISHETLSMSTLGTLTEGAAVNIERALLLGDRLGGHIVQGHVDGVGEIVNMAQTTSAKEFQVRVPEDLARYIVAKGSVAIDGVSLTVNECKGDRFKVTVIPHTELKSTFDKMKNGDRVNLEVDIIGKYVEKLTHLDSSQISDGSKITEEFLKKHGF